MDLVAATVRVNRIMRWSEPITDNRWDAIKLSKSSVTDCIANHVSKGYPVPEEWIEDYWVLSQMENRQHYLAATKSIGRSIVRTGPWPYAMQPLRAAAA